MVTAASRYMRAWFLTLMGLAGSFWGGTRNDRIALLKYITDYNLTYTAADNQNTRRECAHLKHLNNMICPIRYQVTTHFYFSCFSFHCIFPHLWSVHRQPFFFCHFLCIFLCPLSAMLDSIHLNRWSCVNRLILTGRFPCSDSQQQKSTFTAMGIDCNNDGATKHIFLRLLFITFAAQIPHSAPLS